MNRQDACSTKSEFYCGTGILSVKREDFLRDSLESFLLSPLCSDFGCLGILSNFRASSTLKILISYLLEVADSR